MHWLQCVVAQNLTTSHHDVFATLLLILCSGFDRLIVTQPHFLKKHH